MARSVWTGSISFGLVNVPVKAYTAVRDHEVRFHQLHKGTGTRIRHRKVAEDSGEEVDQDDIEMGYEVGDGRYVTFDKEELDEMRPVSTRAVEVTDFVALDDVDPIYYERTYWLAPDGKQAVEAYHLLRAAMEERQRVAVGTVVMRDKQYLTAIRPLDGVLAMSTMRFADEVVPKAAIDELPSRAAEPPAKALRLAEQIIDSLAAEWAPERYHDTYTEQLRDLIERKAEGEDVVVEQPAEEPAKVLDLMAALEASLDSAKQGRRASRSAPKAGRKAARATRKPASKPKKAPARARAGTRLGS